MLMAGTFLRGVGALDGGHVNVTSKTVLETGNFR